MEKTPLTEAKLDYYTQLDKMKQLEAGTRGFNVGAASFEKIWFNYKICLDQHLDRARSAIENGLWSSGYRFLIKPSRIDIRPYDLKAEDYKKISEDPNEYFWFRETANA